MSKIGHRIHHRVDKLHNSIDGFHIALTNQKNKEKLEGTTSNPEEPLDRERQPDPKQIWLWEGDEETVSSGEEEHGRSNTSGRRSNPVNFHQGEKNSHKEEKVGKSDLPRFIEQKTRRKRKRGREGRGGRRPKPPPSPKRHCWLKL
ncbi:unnamed protein product [Camellia sinensis]